MFDLIIRGGDVVTPQGVVCSDVAVAGETIVAIAASGTLAAGSRQARDRSNRARRHAGRHRPARAYASRVDQA